MIDSIKLDNFESHDSTELIFEPGVNIIIGRSDSGKSSIIRAIRWAKDNRPTGEAFRSFWGGDTKVDIRIGEHSIKRIRTDSENKYVIDGKEYESIGTDVPKDVTKLLGIDDVNLQSQLDPPFLLSRSAGKRAEYFNRIAQLDSIDRSIKNVKSKIRKIKRRKESKEEHLEELEESLAEYNFVDELEARVESLEDMENRRRHLKSDCNVLKSSIESIVDVESKIFDYKYLIDLKPKVAKIIRLIVKNNKLQKKVDELGDLIDEIEINSNKIDLKEERIELKGYVEQTLKTAEKRHNTLNRTRKLGELIDKIEDNKNEIKTTKKELKNKKDKFHKEMPDICPLCGREVN